LCLIQNLLLKKNIQLKVEFDSLTQSLRSTAITAASSLLRIAPPQRLTLVSDPYGFSHLDFSLSIKSTGSRSSIRKPRSDSRQLHAGHHLILEDNDASSFDVIFLSHDASAMVQVLVGDASH
jgi:hypothetical protein